MTPGRLDQRVVAERSDWVREMLERISGIPLESVEAFTSDRRNVDGAETCLRRSLEALLDLGRHVLAKAFGDAPAEYEEVAKRLGERNVLTAAEAEVFVRMAGYRNRLVHFYDMVTDPELYTLCTQRLGDVERVLGGLHRWIVQHPDMVDTEP
jgi:uncharacterized protein YutE (UPF0331/DUF86 family)